jgi:mannosyl-glycoprotein endo-beta-N-acetylglucosaminidase
MGVDVWGRGSYGGGGFGCYKAISRIAPESLGLSVALFGPAWTWESEQDKPGWTWDRWWAYESKLWVGPVSGHVEVPEVPQNGSLLPIASFFPRHPPPETSQLSFHTTFCPGTGTAWFVEGVKVFQIQSGWTDVEKQTSVGDMIWPCPKLYWDDDREDEIPKALSSFHMDDAWNGGNSIRLSVSCPGSEEATAAYRVLWLPIQSLHLIPQRSYEAHAIYKLEDNHNQDCETEFALSLKSIPGSQDDLVLNIVSSTSMELTGGWTKLTIQFNFSGNDSRLTAAIGLILAIVSENSIEPLQLSLLLGQLNVVPHLPLSFTEEDSVVLWADFIPTPISNRASAPLLGTLSWEVATSFPVITSIAIKSPEDPLPAWNLQPTIDWFPSFLYFNIYAQPFIDEWNVGTVDKAIWIGTSGSDGQRNGFDVLPENLPFAVNPAMKVRFYIQGVKDCGDVLKWEKCAYVDVSSSH